MANRKLFELIDATPTNSDKLVFGKAGTVTYNNITYGNFKNLIIAAIPAPEFLTKVVNMGSYDMYPGENNKDVDLGVVRSKIRSCTVLILSNDGGLYPLLMQGGNKEIKSYWWIRQELTYASNARVSIRSENNSFFDQTAFNGNGPSNNRGYIYVTYVP